MQHPGNAAGKRKADQRDEPKPQGGGPHHYSPWLDPTVPCHHWKLGGERRTACTYPCCIKVPKPETDSEWSPNSARATVPDDSEPAPLGDIDEEAKHHDTVPSDVADGAQPVTPLGSPTIEHEDEDYDASDDSPAPSTGTRQQMGLETPPDGWDAWATRFQQSRADEKLVSSEEKKAKQGAGTSRLISDDAPVTPARQPNF